MKNLILMLMMLFFTTGCNDEGTSVDTDSDTGSDKGSDTGGVKDTGSGLKKDTDSSSNTSVNEDSDSVYIDSNGVYAILSEVALYDSDTTIIFDTDFDVSGVDMTLGGMLPDVPEPTYDCTDIHVRQNCISLSVVWQGQHKEFLILGNPYGNKYTITIATLGAPMKGYGMFWNILNISNDFWDVFNFSGYIEKWDSLPATFDVVNTLQTNPQILYIAHCFPFSKDDGTVEWGGFVKTSGKNLIEARMAGWAVHSGDYSKGSGSNNENYRYPKKIMFTAKFASSWVWSDGSKKRALKGSMKGYDN